MPARRLWIALGVLVVMGWMLVSAAFAQQEDKPVEHFMVNNPAALTPQRAETIYQNIAEQMGRNYRVSRRPEADAFLGWTRYNTAPYRSATHGARYVSNYANAIGKNYGNWEKAAPLPVGSVLAKDSFTATSDGQVYAGPLFVMEKMPTGFHPPSGDWKYLMIMPDGSVFGETKGDGSENVEFCIGCHAARAEYDHLFFIPEEFRRQALMAQ